MAAHKESPFSHKKFVSRQLQACIAKKCLREKIRDGVKLRIVEKGSLYAYLIKIYYEMRERERLDCYSG